MARQTGYVVTIKAFVPSPKDNFDQQIAAASLMKVMSEKGELTPEFLDIAKVTKIDAKYGSADLDDPKPADDEE